MSWKRISFAMKGVIFMTTNNEGAVPAAPSLEPHNQLNNSSFQGLCQLSVFTKTQGILTKRLNLNDNGSLHKDSGACAMSEGHYQRVTANGLEAVGSLLDGLTSNQTVAYGIAHVESAPITTKNRPITGAITRTKDVFSYPDTGVMMLDYDPAPNADPLSAEELRNTIIEAVPELSDVDMLWRPSAGSCIFNGEVEMVGISGQRLYLLVQPGTRIPELGTLLDKRLWLSGHGRIELSKSGAMLCRSTVDTSVWQPERLDFAAGAVCNPPLTRRPVPNRLFPGTQRVLQASAIKPLTADEERRCNDLVRSAKTAAKPAQEARRSSYIDERLAVELPPDATDELRAERRRTLTMAVQDLTLTADFQLKLDHEGWVSVADVLADKTMYHGATLADPLEPEYGGGRCKAKLYLTGTRPIVRSFAHGGIVYRLTTRTKSIQLVEGELGPITQAIADNLAAEPDLFRNSAGIMIVTEGAGGMHTMELANVETLTSRAAANMSFYTTRPGQPDMRVPKDVPHRPIQLIGKSRDDYGFRNLKGIIAAPTLRPDGSVLSTPGYDPQTKLLLMMDEPVSPIPEFPTEDEIAAAKDTLLSPFAHFDFADPIDKSVLVSSLLTAVVRKTLHTAPGVIISATTAGSGKTKVAQCISVLAGGDLSTQPWVSDPEEQRKTLGSTLLEGSNALIFDNVTGQLRSDIWCNVLTTATIAVRIVGFKEKPRMSTSIMVIWTGNNLAAAGDLTRRTLRINLDPQCEKPWQRPFSFDPVQLVQGWRLELVAAALILLRGYIAVGRPNMVKAHTGSFEQWSKLIRQCVIWLGFADPEQSMVENLDDDPDTEHLRAVMNAWYEVFGDKSVTNDELKANIVFRNVLNDAFGAAMPMVQTITTRTVGNWLKNRKGRVLDGQRFTDWRSNATRGWRLEPMKNEKVTSMTSSDIKSPPSREEINFLNIGGEYDVTRRHRRHADINFM